MKFTRECEIGKTTNFILKIFLKIFDNTVLDIIADTHSLLCVKLTLNNQNLLHNKTFILHYVT